MNKRTRGIVLQRWPNTLHLKDAINYGKVEYLGSGGEWVKELGEARVQPAGLSNMYKGSYFHGTHAYSILKVVVQTETIAHDWDDDDDT